MTALDRARDILHRTESVTALTGAGVSAASGIPTFRGAGGLWKSFKPEQLATAQAFARDPALVWEWYDWRRQLISTARPNAAHDVLARWACEHAGFTLITQNVDGLHERAGTARLLRLHGSIWRLRCWHDCTNDGADWLDERTPLPSLPPRCPHCGALARPAVVWFGEPLNPAIVRQANEAAATCQVFLSIGTSSVVYPAAGLVQTARAHGATIIEINPAATDASAEVDIAVRMPAEEALPALDLPRDVGGDRVRTVQ